MNIIEVEWHLRQLLAKAEVHISPAGARTETPCRDQLKSVCMMVVSDWHFEADDEIDLHHFVDGIVADHLKERRESCPNMPGCPPQNIRRLMAAGARP